MATLYRCLVALNGVAGPKWYQAGDGNIQPSYCVMTDDADEVKICSTSGRPIGVAGCKGDQDLNSTYTSGHAIPIYPKGCGVEIYVLHDGNSAESLDKHKTLLQASSGTAGAVRIKAAYEAKDTTYHATNFTEREDTNNFVIGTFSGPDKSITSGTSQYIKCILNK